MATLPESIVRLWQECPAVRRSAVARTRHELRGQLRQWGQHQLPHTLEQISLHPPQCLDQSTQLLDGLVLPPFAQYLQRLGLRISLKMPRMYGDGHKCGAPWFSHTLNHPAWVTQTFTATAIASSMNFTASRIESSAMRVVIDVSPDSAASRSGACIA